MHTCIATLVNIKLGIHKHNVCLMHVFSIVGIVCEFGCEQMAKRLLEVYKYCVSEGVLPSQMQRSTLYL